MANRKNSPRAEVELGAEARLREPGPPAKNRWVRINVALSAPLWGWVVAAITAAVVPILYWLHLGIF